MPRRKIVALAAAGGLALTVLPASVAPAQSQPGGTTSTPAAGTTSTPAAGTTSTPAAGTTSTPAAGGAGGTSPSGSASGATTPSTGGKTVPAPGAGTTTGAAPTPPRPAKPAGGAPATATVSASASTGGTPAGIILLAVLGGLLLAIGLFVLLARFMGWGFERWQPTVHTWREAGYQTENAISEFGDWARRGR